MRLPATLRCHIDLDPLHRYLTFLSPMSEARADRLVRFLAAGLEGTGGTVADIGCGWGELLLRVVAAAPGCLGFGIEREAGDIAHATEQARRRGLADRVTLVAGDGSGGGLFEPADALICLGASHVWKDGSLTGEPLDYRLALTALREYAKRGARLAYGDAIWSRPPTPEATAPMSGRDDEYLPLAEVVDIAVECGFAPLAVHEATQDEWDAFESGIAAPWAAWLAGHDPDHPGTAEMTSAAARWRGAYLHGYRGVLGMGYLELVAV